MAQEGWFGLPMPQEYGGAGGSVMEMVVLGEELGYVGYDIASAYGATVFCGLNLVRHGSEEQKNFYIPRIISGRLKFAISIDLDPKHQQLAVDARGTPQRIFSAHPSDQNADLMVDARSPVRQLDLHRQ